MALECPNCRSPVSFWRSIRTTAWGRFPCKACGSILGIDWRRRVLAIFPLLAWMAFLILATRIPAYGTAAVLGAYFAVCAPVFYLLERIVLIDRRAFCCRKCGYELEGLTVPRCPECGQGFDPAERERILERIGQPPPRSRHRWVLVLLILALLGTLVLNLITYWRASAPRPPGQKQQQQSLSSSQPAD